MPVGGRRRNVDLAAIKIREVLDGVLLVVHQALRIRLEHGKDADQRNALFAPEENLVGLQHPELDLASPDLRQDGGLRAALLVGHLQVGALVVPVLQGRVKTAVGGLSEPVHHLRDRRHLFGLERRRRGPGCGGRSRRSRRSRRRRGRR